MNHCADCRYWGWGNEKAEEDLKDCQLFSDWPSLEGSHPLTDRITADKLAFVCAFQGADGGTLATTAEFGCVQWQSK